jgi:PAT family beta-lactamase induction signal transducer AmpG
VLEWIVRLLLIGLIGLVIGSGLTGKIDLLAGLLKQFGLSSQGADALIAAWAARPLGVYLQIAAVFAGLAALVLACWPLPVVRTRPSAYLAGSFGHPLRDFFGRFGGLSAWILALICFYRLADFVLVGMNPFYLGLGFDVDEVAEVRKVFGVVASMAGIFIGGLSVIRLGLIRTMVIGAFASPLSNLVFAWLALQGHDLGALFIAIGVDNFAAGYAGTALIAYMSSLTSVGFTATQYALFSSLYALPGKLLASQTGRIIEGSARWADAGGLPAVFMPWFNHLPPETLAKGAETAKVTAHALGAGYMVFFLYSTVIGIFGIALAFFVAPRHKRLLDQAPTPDSA